MIAGHKPVAEWIRDSLVACSLLVITAEDIDSAVRLQTLIAVDAVVAWPAISGVTIDDVLEMAEAIDRTRRRVPVFLVSWVQRYDARAAWVRPPLVADDLQQRVLGSLSGKDDPAIGCSEPALKGRLVSSAEDLVIALVKAS